MILDDISNLHKAMINIGNLDGGNNSKESIILNIIHKTLIKPNSELAWGEKWIMYFPKIELNHLLSWRKISADNM